MLATADEVLLQGIGGISLNGRTANLTATSGIAIQSLKVGHHLLTTDTHLFFPQYIAISGSSLVFPQLPVANINLPLQEALKLCACRVSNTTSFRLFLSPSSCLAANNTHPCL